MQNTPVEKFQKLRPIRTSPRLKHATQTTHPDRGISALIGSGIEATPEPSNSQAMQNLTAAGGALAVLLLVYAALLHGDGIAGCGGSAHGRSVAVIRAGLPMPRKARSLREDELCNGAIRVAVATSSVQCGCRLRSAPRAVALRNQEHHGRLSRPRQAAQLRSLSTRLAD